MSERPSYNVTVSHEDDLWVAVIAGLQGGATESRDRAALETEVRDLVSGLTDVEPDAFDLTWTED